MINIDTVVEMIREAPPGRVWIYIGGIFVPNGQMLKSNSPGSAGCLEGEATLIVYPDRTMRERFANYELSKLDNVNVYEEGDPNLASSGYIVIPASFLASGLHMFNEPVSQRLKQHYNVVD